MTMTPTAGAAPQAEAKPGARAASIDALKGVIMIVMALDHVRSFFMTWDGVKEVWYQPATYNPNFWDFMARYVSHLAAPGFFFLMGMGMVLFAASRRKSGWDEGRIIKNLVIRGLILIACQILLENSAWALRSENPMRFFSTGVLSTLGLSMIFAAFFLRLGWKVALGTGFALLLINAVIIHAYDMNREGLSLAEYLLFAVGNWGPVRVNYPLVPWLGVTLLGVAYAYAWRADAEKTYRWSLYGGLMLIAAFIVMRLLPGFYWNFRVPVDGTALGFMQATKYPPSFSWLALTLGINGVLLWVFSKSDAFLNSWGQFLLDYGRSPLFFYVAHLHIYQAMSQVVFSRHEHIASMAAVWWIVGLIILWPMCRAYGRFKQSTPKESIWRFF